MYPFNWLLNWLELKKIRVTERVQLKIYPWIYIDLSIIKTASNWFIPFLLSSFYYILIKWPQTTSIFLDNIPTGTSISKKLVPLERVYLEIYPFYWEVTIYWKQLINDYLYHEKVNLQFAKTEIFLCSSILNLIGEDWKFHGTLGMNETIFLSRLYSLPRSNA
jgi:hypothetical protein